MIRDYLNMDNNTVQVEGGIQNYDGFLSKTSPHGGSQNGGNNFSLPPSPASSNGTSGLNNEFSQLNLPASNSPNYGGNLIQMSSPSGYTSGGFISYENNYGNSTGFNCLNVSSFNHASAQKEDYIAKLVITEQPVEKFRFRYKSEMHGTHGSLNGANSKRSPKTFPEVQLQNFEGNAVIRCSLFQANLESPHSHQLVVRNGDQDICDPHDLNVSPNDGYIAHFQNMGIIHTAKKFIFDELYKKKAARLRFELGRHELTTKEEHELRKQTEKEAKDMNLNQVLMDLVCYYKVLTKYLTFKGAAML